MLADEIVYKDYPQPVSQTWKKYYSTHHHTNDLFVLHFCLFIIISCRFKVKNPFCFRSYYLGTVPQASTRGRHSLSPRLSTGDSTGYKRSTTGDTSSLSGATTTSSQDSSSDTNTQTHSGFSGTSKVRRHQRQLTA